MENVAIRGRRGAAVPGSSRSDPPRGPRFNQSANSVQANPNKAKQISLDLLGFIRPNRDFSMGYGQKIKKNRLASQVVCKTSHATLFAPFFAKAGGSARPRSTTMEFVIAEDHNPGFRFMQAIVEQS
jgi:hypothetical protein